MLDWLCYPIRSLAAPFWDDAGPHYSGLGAALGAIAGLVPQDNLTALALAALILTLRLNLTTAAVAGLVFAWTGWLCDGGLDALGGLLLEHERTGPLWNAFFALPWAGWTRLNNTIVCGSLFAGLIVSGPTYAAARIGHRLLAPRVDRALRSRAWARVALGHEFVARGAPE